jgi:ankyrin repeat protein
MTDIEKLLAYFAGFYEYDDEGNELPIDPYSFRDVDGDTALHIACRRGDLWAVKMLVEGGVDVNSTGDMEITPLHAIHRAKNVSQHDREAIESYLIEQGADPNLRDGFGLTGLEDRKSGQRASSSKSKWDCDKK